MTAFEAKVKRWGNSMGIIIPAEVLKDRKLKSGQTVSVLLPQGTMMEFWGLLGPTGGRKNALAEFEQMRIENRELEWEKSEKRASLIRGQR